jgi:hypothetical protein
VNGRTRADSEPPSALQPSRVAAEQTDAGTQPVVELDIGLYGSRATDALAATWQRWINSHWAGELEASIAAHPAIASPTQVPEGNGVEVLEPGEHSFPGGWAVDADAPTIAEEAGRLPR